MEETKKSAVELIMDACAAFCDAYCKYPQIAKDEGLTVNEWYEKYCDDCPIGRLI